MENNYQEMNLKPNVRTMAVTGGTAAGKSEVTSVFAGKKARPILSKSVGETNSTLKERLNVYTESLKDEMVVAVKVNDCVYERQDFIDTLSRVLSHIVIKTGKVPEYDIDMLNELLLDELKREVYTKVNTRAILSFLTEAQEVAYISSLVSIVNEHEFYTSNYKIYNTVKNSISNVEVKDNSKKFFNAIQSDVEKEFDQMSEEFKNALWGVWEETNINLKHVFYSYFKEMDVSKDGYYYMIIDLNNPDQEFVGALFTPNDLRNGGKLSLEVFCKEIVIYAPIHENIANLIRNNSDVGDAFKDKKGNISLGIYDTRGLYHADATDEDNTDYFNELLYGITYDALVIVHPLIGDTNEAKIRELYSKTLRKYNKQVPIFILNNKVDLYINALTKNVSSDDPFSNDVPDFVMDVEEIKRSIATRVTAINDEIKNVQSKNRLNSKLISIACWLKKDSSINPELLKEYNVLNSIDTMITEIGSFLRDGSVKIKFKLNNEEDSKIEFEFDEVALKEIVSRYLKSAEVDKGIFAPGLINLGENLGKTPHGNGYNALRRRLKNGDGHNSNIDDSYYYNCQSFAVNFPANLKKLPTESLIKEIVQNVIMYKGGSFVDENATELLSEKIVFYLSKNEFAARLLYDKALMRAESKAFSFKAKFNNFISNCIPYFNRGDINEADYFDSLNVSILSAVNRAIDLHVLYS